MTLNQLLGEPTGGSTGQPVVFNLPGGLQARICVKRDAYQDGKQWIGKALSLILMLNPQ
ncbi:hypothetical protein Q0590_35600 [Rhodocytophaga aerolata]|uniref:Uncharacterized protein n=1 Tax=Rhodocytophaga aerolata TaxID=455078 RepID=A0ABT8RHT6_9BACT|nr:hypothetical protein [Rhodocytophaga aerolata]MDO1451653.1 hypothetical protein [Rhodocytophaga aerolata]